MNTNAPVYYLRIIIALLIIGVFAGCSKQKEPGSSPSVHITSPKPYNGSITDRNLDINASVTPGKGGSIKRVEFYADGTLLPNGTITQAPYDYKWTATSGFGKKLQIMVKAYQANGTSASDTVSVKVWNGITRAAMPTQRYAFTSNAVNGKIYVIGGYDTAQRVVEEYDPATDKWSRKAPPHIGHAAHASCVINNKIYVFGGDKGFEWIPDVEAYDPANDTWTEKKPIPTDNGVAFGMMGCVAFNGKAYLIGGFGKTSDIKVGVYDAASDSWTISSTKNIFWPGAATAANQIFSFGGCSYRSIGACTDANAKMQLYDPGTGSFTDRANMLYKQSAAAVAVSGDKIYVIGGSADNLACMEVYDPTANKWTALPDMPLGSVNFSASTVDNNVYIISSKTFEYFTQ